MGDDASFGRTGIHTAFRSGRPTRKSWGLAACPHDVLADEIGAASLAREVE